MRLKENVKQGQKQTRRWGVGCSAAASTGLLTAWPMDLGSLGVSLADSALFSQVFHICFSAPQDWSSHTVVGVFLRESPNDLGEF